MIGNRTYNRQLRKLAIGGAISLLTVSILSIWLLPFGYMLMTSVKSRAQLSRDTILPLTHQTYTYEGEQLPGYRVSTGDEFPAYKVPTDDSERIGALVQTDEETNTSIFIDVFKRQTFEWTGDVSTLDQGEQIILFKYRGEDVPEQGLQKSKDYPVYLLDGEPWALAQSPDTIFVDTSTLEIIHFEGDITALERAPQIQSYTYPGENDPESGLEKRGRYPAYQPADDTTDVQWAYIQSRGDGQYVYAAFDPESMELIEVVESEQSPAELTPVLQPLVYKHKGQDNASVGLQRNAEYPVYEVEGEQLALIKEGPPHVFLNINDPDAGTFTSETTDLTPLWEPGQWRQLVTDDRANGLKVNEFYDLYWSPDGNEWALVRMGTQTENSVFIDASDPANKEPEILETAVDISSLTPVTEPFVYEHRGAELPEWSLVPGDKLPLYNNPEGDGEWALVKGYLPDAGKASIFIDPENAEAGVFQWDDSYYQTLGAINELDPTWSNFPDAWRQINFPRLLFNTLFIAVVGLIGTLISCTIVAYGFARFPIPGKNILFLILIGTIVLPRQVTLVPTYAFFERINWTNTWLPLIVPHFFANAYNVFLLRQFIQTIPREMDEAAMIDGAGPLRVLWSVIVPQAWPALVAAGLFHFVFAWNDYFEPLIYTLGAPELQPISVGVQQFNFIYNERREMIQATSLMALALPVFLFFLAQRYFMQGVVVTGVDK